jgi:hypothetical protein
MDLCLLRRVCCPHSGGQSNTPRRPEQLASQEGGGSRGRRRRRRDEGGNGTREEKEREIDRERERERERERDIPPADATRSIERTNKLSCFKDRTKRLGDPLAHGCSAPSRPAWRLLIFNTQFFIRVFVVSAGSHGGATRSVFSVGRLTRCPRP